MGFTVGPPFAATLPPIAEASDDNYPSQAVCSLPFSRGRAAEDQAPREVTWSLPTLFSLYASPGTSHYQDQSLDTIFCPEPL